MENPKIRDSAENIEDVSVKIEYSYKGYHQNILITETGGTFDLVPAPEGAVEFDGYIETSLGSFAFQGDIKTAQKLLSDIKKYCEVAPDIRKRLEEIADKIETEEQNKLYAGPTKGDDFEAYSAASSKLSELRKEEEFQKRELMRLEQVINKYKV